MKKIAFVFVAEPYQCYHGASVAFAMAKMADVRVAIYYNDPDSVYHLDRIRVLYSAAPMNYIRMKRSLFTTFASETQNLWISQIHRLPIKRTCIRTV